MSSTRALFRDQRTRVAKPSWISSAAAVVNSKTIAAQATVFSEVEVFIGGSSITNAVSGSVFAGATSGSSAFLDIEFGSDGTFTNSGSVTVSASASSEGELSISGGTVTNAKTIQVVANGQSDVFGISWLTPSTIAA